jgi:beta-galactosidase
MYDMKKHLTAFIGLSALTCMGMNEVWRDSTVFRINKEPARAEFTLHDSREAALKPLDLSNPWNSRSYMSLNGTWDFNWYGRPDAVPVDWYQAKGGVKKWDSIAVPGTWQGAGFDRLYYLNVTMPFEYDWSNNAERRPEFNKENIEKARRFGFIPDDAQTVGCYRKWVDLSAEQLKGRTVLRIGAAEAGLKVFVNDREVGYSQGSFLPAEFDLTAYVKPGKNLISIELYRWTDGSYMEVQDMIRFAGIYRDVFLRFEPLAHISDIYFMGTPDQSLRTIPTTYRVKVANRGEAALKNAKVKFD